MKAVRGQRNQAAYPIWDGDGRPAWHGVIVIEPADYLWTCPHVHDDWAEAVRCAQEHDAAAGWPSTRPPSAAAGPPATSGSA